MVRRNAALCNHKTRKTKKKMKAENMATAPEAETASANPQDAREANLARLNRLHAEYEAATKALAEIYAKSPARDKAVEEAEAKVDGISAAFDTLRARMDAVLFDTRKGEYFYPRNAEGQRVWRIHVTRTESGTVAVIAPTEEKARAAAIGAFTHLPSAPRDVSVTAVNVGISG